MISANAIQWSEGEARHARGESASAVNVGHAERLASEVGGGLLVAAGLRRGGLGGLMMAGLGGMLIYRGLTGHCRMYEALGVDTAEPYEPGLLDSVPAGAGVRVEEAVTIDRPADELYRYWYDYANLPKFMANIESVTDLGGGRSHWIARGPMGVTLEWDAEIHNEAPNELIAWRSLDGAQVETAGSVRFSPAPGGRGTEVRVNQKVNPPGGRLGVAVAKIFGDDPARQTRENLRRLKQIMEAGTVPTVQDQPSGRQG